MRRRFFINWKLLIQSLFSFFVVFESLSQNCNCHDNEPKYFGPTKKEIVLDINNIPETDVPFDRWFYFKKELSNTDDWYGAILYSGANLCCTLETKIKESENGQKTFFILTPPLEPQKKYSIKIIKIFNRNKLLSFLKVFSLLYNDTSAAQSQLQRTNHDLPEISRLGFGEIQIFFNSYLKNNIEFKNCLTDVNGLSDKCSSKLINLLTTKTIKEDFGMGREEEVLLFASYEDSNEKPSVHNTKDIGFTTLVFNYDTRTAFSVFPNFGYVAYGLQSDFVNATPFVGATFNFRYLDRDIPLSKVFNVIDIRRIGFTLGITSSSIVKEKFRADFLTNNVSLMAGLEYRITHSLKLGYGYVFYWKLDPNPLINNRSLGYAPYVGLSLDLKLKQVLSDLGTLFTTNKIDIKK
jgi:hypothetical protein